jgi:anti-sigma B factor antagonist
MTDPEQLEISVRGEAERAVLVLAGELDLATAHRLEEVIRDDGLTSAGAVVIDLERLDFIDSTGLRTMLAVRELCVGRGQDFAVTPGSTQVQRLLNVTGVGAHLGVVAPTDGGLSAAGA